MRINISSIAISALAASACLAQHAVEVAPVERLTTLRARDPIPRPAPEIAVEQIQLPATVAPAVRPKPNAAGYVEPAPAGLLTDPLWQVSADGQRMYAAELSSEGAHALRVRFDPDFESGLRLYVYDPAGGTAFGPYERHHLARTEWWSTVIFGDTIGLLVVAQGGDDPPRLPEIIAINYGYEPPTTTLRGCMHRDVSCEPAWQEPADAVVLLATVDGSGNLMSTFCTGALMNRTPMDGAPLVMTANHCLGSQGAAGPTVYVWFFQTDSCNGSVPNLNTLPRSDGSLLLKRHTNSDWNLVGLYEPPAATSFLGWSSGYWDDDSPATGIHHPGGSFKRISFGTKVDERTQTFCDMNGQNCFDAEVWDIEWNVGFTQPGSSGSPIMSSLGVVRGTLSGGPSGCTVSRYGRFDLAFANLRYYLHDVASPAYVSGDVGGDPGNNGTAERGTFSLPFNTVYEGSFAVRAGDTVRIKPGNYNERFTIWRPMTLTTSQSGIVRIGQP